MKTIYVERDSFWGRVVSWLYFKIVNKSWNHLESYSGGYRDDFTDAYAYSTDEGRFTYSYSCEQYSELGVKLDKLQIIAYSD